MEVLNMVKEYWDRGVKNYDKSLKRGLEEEKIGKLRSTKVILVVRPKFSLQAL